MKILYGITASNWGGAQENVYQLIKYQYSLNNKIILVVGNKGPLVSVVKSEFPQVKIYILKHLVREIRPYDDLRAIIDFRKIIKKESPNIIHLHSSKAGTIGRLSNIGFSSKTMFTVHGWPFTEGINKVKRRVFTLIEKIMEPLTDEYICVSKYDENLGKKYIFNLKKNNFVTIHNGVDNFSNNIKYKKSYLLPIKFIMVARFSNQKDQAGLLKAVKSIDKSKFRIIFVGTGPTLINVKKLAIELGLEKQIDFVGFKRNVNDYLKVNDVFVLTSHYEGLPYSIIEAMSLGLPVIASNVGGNNELVTDGFNGFLVNNNNQIRKAIESFIDSPELIKTMGKNSLKLFNKEFKLEKQLKKINETYNKFYR